MSADIPGITIRRASSADVLALGRLGALLVRTHHDFDPQRFIPATPKTEQGYGSFLGTQLGEANVVLLVAERDGEVIGYAYGSVEGYDYMSLRGPAGVLNDIVVDPPVRYGGYVVVPNRPGIGIELREDQLNKFPYRPHKITGYFTGNASDVR